MRKKKVVRPHMGSRWRTNIVSADGKAQVAANSCDSLILDEVVIDDWFHIEQMDTNCYWIRVGEHVLTASKRRDGKLLVIHEVDECRAKPADDSTSSTKL